MSHRTRVTTSQGTPRDHGPHGITLLMRYVKRTAPIAPADESDRDRSLRGKARRQARKAARR